MQQKRDGFSLIEMMVSMTVFLVIIGIAAGVVRLANFDLRTNRNISQVQQYVRGAMGFLDYDITNSGYNYVYGNPPSGATGAKTPGGISGPLVTATAFRAITGVANLPLHPQTAAPEVSQELFCIVPLRRADNLGNGADANMGSSDRLTVAYEDELFVAGNLLPTPPANTTPDVDPNELSQIVGSWNGNANPPTFTVGPNRDLGSGYTISYNTMRLRVGDVVLLSALDPDSNQVNALAMVTNINQGAGTISFDGEALGLNSVNRALPFPAPRFADGTPNLTNYSPLDRMRNLFNVNDVKLRRVRLFTYFVDPQTRQLIRRRYGYAPAGAAQGNAFEDDPVCQNVERFWVRFNKYQPGSVTTAASLTADWEIDTNDNSEIDTTTNTPVPRAMTDPHVLTTLQRIRRVNVVLVARSSERDQRTGEPARFTLESSFAARNIGYYQNQNLE